MYIQQSASVGFPLSLRVRAILTTLAHAVKFIRSDNNVVQSYATGSKLERHLRYDIGEIDYDPQRSRSLDKASSDRFRLWLHYPR
jgi:hypothetical protein